MDKGSGSGIFPDPGDEKRPDPTGSGSATLYIILYLERRRQKYLFLLQNCKICRKFRNVKPRIQCKIFQHNLLENRYENHSLFLYECKQIHISDDVRSSLL